MTKVAGPLLKKWFLAKAIIAQYGVNSISIVGFRLLDHYNAKTKRCNPSYNTLARGASVGRRAAIAAVRQLWTDGWIRINGQAFDANFKFDRKNAPRVRNDFDFDWSRAVDGESENTRVVNGESLASDPASESNPLKPNAFRFTHKNTENKNSEVEQNGQLNNEASSDEENDDRNDWWGNDNENYPAVPESEVDGFIFHQLGKGDLALGRERAPLLDPKTLASIRARAVHMLGTTSHFPPRGKDESCGLFGRECQSGRTSAPINPHFMQTMRASRDLAIVSSGRSSSNARRRAMLSEISSRVAAM